MKWLPFRKRSARLSSNKPSLPVFQEAKLVLRPDGDLDALAWDVDIAREYRALGNSQAFVHFLTAMRLQRESFVRAMLNEEKDAGKWREAIRLCDALLAIPERMVEDGRESGLTLAKLGRVRDE